MKRLIVLLMAAGAAWLAFEQQEALRPPTSRAEDSARNALATAFERRQSNVQVEAQGVVVRLLTDDNDGSRHQRFIVQTGPGHTVLIAHNIDLAPRVTPLAVGDTVRFSGEYEWNEQGGVVHWTHRDPAGRHQDGWIRRGDW